MDGAAPAGRRRRRLAWSAGVVVLLAVLGLAGRRHPVRLIPRHLGVEAPPGVRVARAFTDRWYAGEPTWRLHLVGPSNAITRIVADAGFVGSGGPARQAGGGRPGWWSRALGRDRWIPHARGDAHPHPARRHQVESLYLHESGTELLYSGFDP